MLQPKDLVIAISGSGNSENVIRAVDYANDNGAVTLGLCGYDGGRLKQKAQHVISANVNDMQLCEDVHAVFGHIVMQKLSSLTEAPPHCSDTNPTTGESTTTVYSQFRRAGK